MKKILLSLGTIFALGVMVAGGTAAFFGDTEVSPNNIFTAGAIDLQIDNESYYNGARNDGLSWDLKSLEDGADFFFKYLDLKPDDEGEDTISLHVNNNDAWACMQVSVDKFDDNGCTEPEADAGDDTCGNPGPDEGELQNEINFVWWADDGDNVLEDDEDEGNLVFGPETLANLAIDVPLADSSGQGILSDGPLTGGDTYYIGKAWCYGTMTLTPVEQDNQGKTGSNGPLVRGTGISCEGTGVGNLTQTDSVEGTVSFSAVQSRHNDNFFCVPPVGGSIRIVKQVTNNDNGQANPGDFEFQVDGDGGPYGNLHDGDVVSDLTAGDYTVSETDGPGGYTVDFSQCGNDGTVTVVDGQQTVCTIVNDDIPPTTLTVIKQLPNDDGGTAVASDWTYTVDGGVGVVLSGAVTAVSPDTYNVTESGGPTGYLLSYDGDCDDEGNVTVNQGEQKTCILINDDQSVTLTVDKRLDVTTAGIDAGDFQLHILGPNGDQIVSDNVPTPGLPAGDYTISEISIGDAIGHSFSTTIGGACTDNNDGTGSVTLAPGDDLLCTILNREEI